MNAYRALERGQTPQSPHNWLIAIAHNVCRQRFRQASRRVQEVGLDEDVADAFVGPEEDDAPSTEDIRRALGHLAFNQRAALVMRELEGRSYAEVAEVFALSVGAVETLLFRARRALREQLEGSLTCGGAEQAISRQLDGRLSRTEPTSSRRSTATRTARRPVRIPPATPGTRTGTRSSSSRTPYRNLTMALRKKWAGPGIFIRRTCPRP